MLNQLLLSITENFLLFVSLCTILGLMVGSFLNVVIYRLPIMLERAWKQECETYLSASTEQTEEHENNNNRNSSYKDRLKGKLPLQTTWQSACISVESYTKSEASGSTNRLGRLVLPRPLRVM